MTTTPEYLNHFLVKTREQLIKDLLNRFDEGEEIYIPFIYSRQVLWEMQTSFGTDERHVAKPTDEQFRLFVSYHSDNDWLNDVESSTATEILNNVLKETN